MSFSTTEMALARSAALHFYKQLNHILHPEPDPSYWPSVLESKDTILSKRKVTFDAKVSNTHLDPIVGKVKEVIESFLEQSQIGGYRISVGNGTVGIAVPLQPEERAEKVLNALRQFLVTP